MANDTKKINDLVTNDDTSELEVLTATVVFNPDIDYEAESDAATHSFGSGETFSTSDGDDPIAALKSDLQRREENISNLQYDIEELRARWTGLEKELKAREALTDNITTELEQSNRKLAQTISLLKKRDSTIIALEKTLQEQQAGIVEADGAAEQARQHIEALQSDLVSRKEEYRAAAARVAVLDSELVDERSKLRLAEESGQEQEQRIRHLQQQHDESLTLVATLQQYIEGRKSRWERQDAELKVRGKALKNRKKEVARLAKEARTAAEQQRKDQLALQRLNDDHGAIQAELERTRADAHEQATALAEAEESLRSGQEEVSALIRQVEEAATALEWEQAARRQLDGQLSEQQQNAETLRDELTALQQAYAGKEAGAARHEQEVAELTAQLGQVSGRLAAEETERAALAQQLASARSGADRWGRELEELRAQFAEKNQQANDEQQRSGRLADELAAASRSLSALQSAHQALETERDTLQNEATAWRRERDALLGVADKAEALEQTRTELAGLLSSSEAAVRELKAQLSKTEGYADVLRDKLQQQQAEAEVAASARGEAEASLAAAIDRVEDLTARLEAEQQQGATLRQERDEAEQMRESEIRRLDEQVGTLTSSLDESQRLTEQLTADLLESTGLRRALEDRLAEADANRDREIQGLSKQVARLRQQIDDYERKISTKDAAINALLSELAHKPDQAAEAAADDVVHRLADRRAPAGDERIAHEKDRVTRLLIGSIDGQELRFPLFKDKLTIGRTVHNDIQLKAQYVSRRHAVVMTEDDQTRIVDWGSKNGLYVNGRRVTEVALKNGDRVTVGTAEFKFEERPKR